MQMVLSLIPSCDKVNSYLSGSGLLVLISI